MVLNLWSLLCCRLLGDGSHQSAMGQENLNILMLAVVYKGVAIPIYWLLLNKKCNSDTRERIAIVKRFIWQFGKERLLGILADREFIVEHWLTWLKTYLITYKTQQL